MSSDGWIAMPAGPPEGGPAYPCDVSEFDITTGDVLAKPATEPIRTFPVREVGGELEVDV